MGLAKRAPRWVRGVEWIRNTVKRSRTIEFVPIDTESALLRSLKHSAEIQVCYRERDGWIAILCKNNRDQGFEYALPRPVEHRDRVLKALAKEYLK